MRSANRLRSQADFARASRGGKRVGRPQFQVSYVETSGPVARVGFAVGRRIGGAVVRNRIRRRLREAMRPLLPALVACDVVVAARPPAVDATVDELRAALTESVAEAGLLRSDGSLHNGVTDPD